MTFVGTAIIGAGVIGGAATIYASTQQQKSQQAAIDQQRQTQQQATNQITQLEQPFVDYSKTLQPTLDTQRNTLNTLLTPGPSQTDTLKQLPGFQFAEDMAKWGIQAGAGRSGFSGTTAYQGGSLAEQIALGDWASLISPLQSLYNSNAQLYGTGANAATNAGGQISGVTTGTGNNISSLLSAQGQTAAGGITGASGSLTNALTLNALLSGIKNKNTGATPDPTVPQQPYQFAGGPFQG